MRDGTQDIMECIVQDTSGIVHSTQDIIEGIAHGTQYMHQALMGPGGPALKKQGSGDSRT